MFFNRMLFKGAPGQLPALRQAMRGVIQPGSPLVLAERLWGDGPCFALLRAFETLDELEKARDAAFAGPPPFSVVAPLLREPPANELWELPDISLANPPAAGAGTGRFTVRWRFDPVIGKGGELIQAVRGMAADIGGDRPSSFWLRVAGGPFSVGLVYAYESLAAIEQARAAAMANPRIIEHRQKLACLVTPPNDTPEIFEILVRPG